MAQRAAEGDFELVDAGPEQGRHVEPVGAVLVGDLGEGRAVEADRGDGVDALEDEIVAQIGPQVRYVQSTRPIHDRSASLSSR